MAHPEHADQRGHGRRARGRRGAHRSAPGRRGHVRRLHDAGDGPARQPRGEAPLHVRRRARRPAHDPGPVRGGRRDGRAPQPEPRGVVRPRAGPPGHRAIDSRRRVRRSPGRDPQRRPGPLSRAPGALLAAWRADRSGCSRSLAGPGPTTGRRRDDPRLEPDGLGRARGRRSARRGRRRGRGRRPPRAQPARPRRHRHVRPANPARRGRPRGGHDRRSRCGDRRVGHRGRVRRARRAGPAPVGASPTSA
jgi:hypothetical protein